ncbi:MAG: prepilin-type N-terminal cleavage/methylation domain-containing protein [Pseudomonadota bacterium]
MFFYCPHGKQQGMTLVEILMALLMISLLTGAIYTFYDSEQRAYQRQYQAQQRDQQLRFAMNSLVQELLEAGYNASGSGLVQRLSEWVPGAFIAGVPLQVRLDANPKITLGNGISPDMITFLSILPTDNASALLTAPSSGTDIRLGLSESEIAVQFKSGDLLCLGEGETYAMVTGVSKKTLTLDTDPATPGNQPLTHSYPAGTVAGEISVVTYAVFNAKNDPKYKHHTAGIPELKRKVNADGFQPVAENISNMQLSLEEDGRIKIVLTAILNPLLPGKGDEQDRGEREATSLVRIRNSHEAGIGSVCPWPCAPANFRVLSALNAKSPCRIVMAWEPVVTDINGGFFKSDACAVKEYRIFFDVVATTYGNHIDVAACPEEGVELDVKKFPADIYYVSVAAINAGGLGVKTAEIAVADTVAPSRPAGLAVVPDPAKGVVLAWETSSDCDLAGYRLFRKTGADGVFTLLSGGLIPAGAPGFLDTNPPPAETSWYAVRSEDHGFNLSPFSETVSVIIPASPAPEDRE